MICLRHIALLTLFVSPVCLGDSIPNNQDVGLDAILNEIQSLEGKSDPKCYATASRLEDFMYGTPLTDEARFYKNQWQKKMAAEIWRQAAMLKIPEENAISDAQINTVLENHVAFKRLFNQAWQLSFKQPAPKTITILADEVRQYGSIAYSLRAILAVQQENLLQADALPPLAEKAINTLKEKLDLLTLALLQDADKTARLNDRYEMLKDDLVQAETSLGLHSIMPNSMTAGKVAESNNATLLRRLIKQKVASYEDYNQISNQLFVRNLQVYFARLSWPKDEEQAKALKAAFIESMTDFATLLYQGSMQLAIKNQHPLITESDVAEFSQQLLPHVINDYEDAIFFPNLPKEQQIMLEAYDMDSFRDGGLHWRYLEFALDNPALKAQRDADPFAAELLTENIAQFAVLLLRVAGMEGMKAGDERLKAEHIHLGLAQIQASVKMNQGQPQQEEKPQLLASSDLNVVKADSYYTDITEAAGIDLMHRSSDWLNRLLRSYLKKDESTGIITIPPAFGGSGVAAEDINNDGLVDLLILSGLGNHVYLNQNKNGKHGFVNITRSTGLDWKRPEDNQPGEPRQPLIADFNNDGWQDIMITYVDDDHRVYKNLGNGRFEDMTATAGFGGKGLVAGPATVFDYDRDGLLDVYVSYFGDYIHGVLPTLKRRNDNGLANKLFRNLGDFKFQDVTEQAGVGDTGWGQALTHSDINGDGWQDLIVGNDFGVNVYYINQRNGTFVDMAATLGTDKPSYTMSTGVADLNRDLIPDIYISNIVTMNKDEKYVLPNEQTEMKFNADKLAHMRVVEANDLFLSKVTPEGKIRFELSDAVGRGYSSTGWSWDADFFDADMDGDDDLYVLNGMNEFNLYSSKNPYYSDPKDNQVKNIHIPVSTKESNVFFLNHGGRLKNVSHQSGLDLLGNSRSAAYFDFDNDGDLDIILNNYHDKAVLYRSNANRMGNNWIKIRPLGDPSKGVNRDAIGTRLLVTSELGHQVWREVHGSTGYLSVHPKVQHFGVGKAPKVTIKVAWPNGVSQQIDDVPVNRSYIIDQRNNSVVPQ